MTFMVNGTTWYTYRMACVCHTIVLVNSRIVFLDLQKVQEIIRKHYRIFLQLFWITYFNIVWLSLMRVTDWLNTVTWLTNISVCCPPRAAEEEHCSIPQYVSTPFTQTNDKNELAILSLQTCMLTALDRALAVYCAPQYNKYALHCALGEKNWEKISTSSAEAGKGNGEPYNITDGDFVVGNITECS